MVSFGPLSPSEDSDSSSHESDPSLSGTEASRRGSAPHYEALSYTWGESTQDHTILLNGGVRISITDNLHRALRRVRYVTKIRTLWIDALCINQDDDIERSHQVQVMGLIYKTASCVNIWLGEPGFVFPISRMMLRWAWKHRARLLKLNYLQPDPRSYEWDSFSWHVLCFHPEAMEKAIRRSSPRWYDRVWVAQEYILATKSYFCYGSRRSKNLPILDSVARALSEPRFEHVLKLESRVRTTWESTKLFSRADGSLGSHGIQTVAACDANDPRDRVYGVLGFINLDEKTLVSVDYSLPPGQVFAAATAASMVVQQDHDILRFVDICDRKTAGLPSWAVDFVTVIKMVNVEIRGPYYGQRPSVTPQYIAYNRPSVDTLYVKAHDCGTVANIVPLHSASRYYGTSAYGARDNVQPSSTYLRYEDWCHEFVLLATCAAAESIATTDAHNSGKPDVMFLEMLASDIKDANVEHLGAKLQSQWRYVKSVHAANHEHPLSTESRNVVKNWMEIVLQASNNLYITPKTSYLELRDVYDYALHALAASNGCCLFSTSTGLVGISPSSITLGDLLVLGQGNKFIKDFPFLMLRSKEDHYQFRGLPIVHGLNSRSDPLDQDRFLPDLAAWAGVTQEREWFGIR